MLKRPAPFDKRPDGTWKLQTPLRRSHSSYGPALEIALNQLDPIFNRAQKRSEFEFVCTLIRVRGSQSAGWDSYETLRELCRALTKTHRLRNERLVAHFALIQYGLILEADEPYETIANLLNIISGGRFHHTNFPDTVDTQGRARPQHPQTKIDQLKSRARAQGLDLSYFDTFVDNRLRNAIFHCDYTIHWPEVRTLNPTKRYDHHQWLTLVNRAQAHYEVFDYLIRTYTASYDSPRLVDAYPGFSSVPNEKAVILVRKGHGAIGLQHNWTPAELAAGQIPFRLGRFLPYEPRLLSDGRHVGLSL